MSGLSPYMGFVAGAREEGALLVFAHDVRQARRLAWPTLRDWFDGVLYIDARVRRVRGTHIFTEADPEAFREGRPHVVESPTSCDRCMLWGQPIGGDGLCPDCRAEVSGAA